MAHDLIARARPLLNDSHPKDRVKVLAHNAFHPGNLLWSRGRLTGVTDWASARMETRASEVAYCRTDVALLHGLEAADAVADHYRALTSDPLEDLALWDPRSAVRGLAWYPAWLGGYAEQGLRGLPPATARRNLLSLAESALRRLSGSSSRPSPLL